jgi:hypothetical protein
VFARFDARNRLFWERVQAYSAVEHALLLRSSKKFCMLRSQQVILFIKLALQHGSQVARRKRIS